MILSMKSIVLGHINICTLTHTQPAICDQALFSYFLFVYLFSLPMSFVIGFVTRLRRRLSLVEQELLTLPEHLSSPLVLVGFVLLSLQFYVYVLQIVVCPFVLFLLAIVLSVLLRYTDSDYPFGIFKLFLSIMMRDFVLTHKHLYFTSIQQIASQNCESKIAKAMLPLLVDYQSQVYTPPSSQHFVTDMT